MAISFLKFGKESFKGHLTGMPMHYPVAEVASQYSPGNAKTAAVAGNLWEAVKILDGKSPRKCYIGAIKGGYVVELNSTDDSQVEIVKVTIDNTNTVKVKAAVKDNTKDNAPLMNIYRIWDKATNTGYSGTAILLACVLHLNETCAEAKERFNDLKNYTQYADDDAFWLTSYDGELVNLKEFGHKLAMYTDTIYRNITNTGVNNSSIRLFLPEVNQDTNKDINQIYSLTQGDLKIKVKSNILGDARNFAAAAKNTTKTSDFALNTNYSDAEKAMVPSLDGYDVPEWVKSAAKYCKLSSKYAEPIRTFFFVGPAGCGKSVGSRLLAGSLGLVYDIITCNPDMEIFDFIGQIYPNTGNKALDFNAVRMEMNLPSTADIMLDPETAYIQIYKKAPDTAVDEGELVEAMISLVNKEVAKRLEGKDYIYVEGPLTKAVRYGYAVEIQEIGIVKRPGVAVGLNAILESGKNAFITLPTGETLKKHENAVIIFTSNNGYTGTANLNQSVLSRMGDVRYFQNEKVDVMAKRTKNLVTDFADDKILHQMAEIIEQISTYCADKGIDDGVCGQRELNNWAMEIMCDLEDSGETEINFDVVRECAQRTVINKVSQDTEAIEEVATACIDALFGECSMYE